MSHPLIAFSQPQHAELLANHLRKEGIAATVIDYENQHIVALTHVEDKTRAIALCEAYVKAPYNPKYQQQAWDAENIKAIRGSFNFKFADFLSWCKNAPLTAALFIICSIVFAAWYAGFNRDIERSLMMQPLSMLWNSQQWWRLLGPSIIHFSVLHYVFNLLWWCMLGAQIEQRLGKQVLFSLFFVSSVLTSIMQTLVSGPNFGGLSGVVYAVLGFVWWGGWLKPAWGLALPKSVVGLMLVWLLLGYADVLWVSMANTAHLVGLVSGCAMAWLMAQQDDEASTKHS